VVSNRIFVIYTIDTIYGGAGFFERQYPRGKAHVFSPYIDNIVILFIG
jgi:hypothetical protein